jgi:predicted metal-dependent phosphotriesterase family hydrolase
MSDVATILGSVSGDALGVTLMHEHVVPRAQIPQPEGKPRFAPRVGVEDYIRELRYVYDTYDVRSVVDCTPRRSPEELKVVARIARETGLNIVVATGCMKEQYYHASRANVSNFWAYRLSADEIADVMTTEICSGINGTDVRAGIIKVGTSKERITAPEERVLRGAARTHLRTGCPITTHATLGTMGADQARIFQEEGADMRRVVIGHSDLNHSPTYHEGIVRRGATVGFDTIGKQRFDYTRPETAGLHRYEFEKEQYAVLDTNRLRTLVELLARGHEQQIVLSMDLGEIDENPSTFAAYGYAYLFARFLPMLREGGLSEGTEREILVRTPRRVLSGDD